MKILYITLLIAFVTVNVLSQVGIGTQNPSNSSMLEISSTSDGGNTYKALMPPRVPTVTERNIIKPSLLDVGLLIFVESIGCLQIWNGTNWENIHCMDLIAIEPWINEFHYDNEGGDIGEFVEISGPAGLDLSNYRLLFYNGADGALYYGLTLSGLIDNESNGFGAIKFYYENIQNGPDGIAFIKVSTNKVLQFISYEGSFIATNNVANGIASTNINVFEQDITPAGSSLQLTGMGNSYENFTWNGPFNDSPGELNEGQIID